MSANNTPAPGVSFFTPCQAIPAGTAVNPQPGGKPIPLLFQPFKIRGVDFQNRIFLSPMCQYSAKNGLITPWHFVHLGGILTRGPGLTFVEASAVLPEGRITPDDVGIWSDEHTKAFSSLTEFAHSQNQKIGIQLAHAGRKATCIAPWLHASSSPLSSEDVGGWPEDVWAPSSLQYRPGMAIPKELTKEGIVRITAAFKKAAIRAVEAGFDVIEIHAAHGYLLSSFLSPATNKRTDQYGGSFENRIRFLLDVVNDVRSVIPLSMPLFVRISGTDWLDKVAPEESWTANDTARLAPILEAHSVDLFDISGGSVDPRQQMRFSNTGYLVPYATAAKEALAPQANSDLNTKKNRMLVSTIGGLADATLAEQILQAGRADVIFIGRQFLKNPGLVSAFADQLGLSIRSAVQIQWAFEGRGLFGLGPPAPQKLAAVKENSELTANLG